MAVGELLLEFAGQALLDLVETREEWHGDEDHDGALAMADFELWWVDVSFGGWLGWAGRCVGLEKCGLWRL